MAQHVLVFSDHPHIRDLLATAHETEGSSSPVLERWGDALIVLRSSLHPLVAIVDCFHSPADLLGFFFGIVRDHPDWYSQHRYFALHSRKLSEIDQTLLRELGVTVLTQPFDVYHLLDLVSEAASPFPKPLAAAPFPLLLFG